MEKTIDKLGRIMTEIEQGSKNINELNGQAIADHLLNPPMDKDLARTLQRMEPWREVMNNHYRVSYYYNLEETPNYDLEYFKFKRRISRLKMKLVNVVKKVIRKSVTFMLKPMSEQQSRYNESVTMLTNEMYFQLLNSQKQIIELKEKIECQEKLIEEILCKGEIR